MSFRPRKSSQSIVMQSLSKIALEKGLIKLDNQIKTAAPKVATADLKPTNNLTQNIIKLCAGLRENGFANYADELENHLVNYKKAQSLYHTSDETGEDVIENAHPNGSTKLEGIDSDEAVVEDILDKHEKMVDVAEKNPTAKNASAIQAVKNIFANQNLDVLYATATDAFNKFRTVYTSMLQEMGDDLDTNRNYFEMIQKILESKKIYSSNVLDQNDMENILTDIIQNYKSDAEPSYLAWGRREHSAFSPENMQKWQSIQKYFPILKKYADRFQTNIHAIQQMEKNTQSGVDAEEADKFDPEGKANSSITDLTNKFTTLQRSISSNADRLKNIQLPNAKTQQDLVKWLNDTQQEINQKMIQLQDNPADQKSFQQYYDTTLAQINQVSNYIQQV